jgi:hypothetical protein
MGKICRGPAMQSLPASASFARLPEEIGPAEQSFILDELLGCTTVHLRSNRQI